VFSQIKLEDVVLNGTYSQKSVSGFNTIDNDSKYVIRKGNKIVLFDMKSGDELETIFDIDDTDDQIKSFFKFSFSEDEKQLLIYTNRKKLYRHSYKADIYLWNIDEKQIQLIDKGIEIPEISPDGKKVAFIKNNNIYFKNIETKNLVQVTTDGKYNHIINGKPDWVYEEEFGYNKAYIWSENSNFIAYTKFDESKVKIFNMTMFAGSHPNIKANRLYPENYTFKYPKAGEKNSNISLHIYNVKNTRTADIKINHNYQEFYIPRIFRTAQKDVLATLISNRHQNEMDIVKIDLNTMQTSIFYKEKNQKYIDEGFLNNIHFKDNNENIYFISEKSKYSHIHKFNTKTKKETQITKGDFDVTNFHGIDGTRIYYSSAEKSPLERNLYTINIDGTRKKILTPKVGWNSVGFTKSLKYYINYYSTCNEPNRISLNNNNGQEIKELANNNVLKEKIENLPKKELFSFQTENGINLNGWMIKPTNFNENKKYPVLMTQYSGPGSQQVKNSFSFNWYNYLAQEEYIVVCVDGRGTGARGEAFKKVTYLNLGKYETIDQVATAKFLSKKSYVDSKNIAIWGWSFGGFTVLNAMQKGDGIFKAGISIAPVTNWRYYDTIYTERYLRTPQENEKGYDNNSPIESAKDLEGNLLICAGTADDNVHYQNTMEYVEQLVQNNILFEMQIYNNRNHSIYGGNTRLHLYKTFTNFLKKNLK
jgi:dipeptidyl-peptidase-4